jgi:hypothetical protein
MPPVIVDKITPFIDKAFFYSILGLGFSSITFLIGFLIYCFSQT